MAEEPAAYKQFEQFGERYDDGLDERGASRLGFLIKIEQALLC